jgi:hypothetical protein
MRGAIAVVKAATHRVVFCAPRIMPAAAVSQRVTLARFIDHASTFPSAPTNASQTCAVAAPKLEIGDVSRYTTNIGRESVRIERRSGAGRP